MQVLDSLKSRRREELLALLYGAGALLSTLALASYDPFDPSLNVAAPALRPVRNLVGLAGAYASDLFFQLLGLVAFTIPLGLTLLCWRKALRRPAGSALARIAGAVLLALSLCASLALPPLFEPSTWSRLAGWRWQGSVAPGGLLGTLLASALVPLLNLSGTLVALALGLVGSLYLLTAFSFSQVRAAFAWVGGIRQRWASWRERRQKAREERQQAREKAKMRARLEKMRAEGRPPVVQTQFPGPSRSVPVQPRLVAPAVPQTLSQPAASRRTDPPIVPLSPATPAGVKGDTPVKRARLAGAGGFRLPSLALLREPDPQEGIDEEELKNLAAVLKMKCDEFDVSGAVTQINPGPVVTTFEFKPEAGVKYSRVTNLVDDLCLALQAESILIERIPGKSTVGIEVPNQRRTTIMLREVIESPDFTGSPSRLTIALGKDINGRIRIADLASMPHLLIAGSTGSGKSVAINSFICSILYKATPEQVRLILVDPKRLELGLYEGVPHLMTPIINEPKLAANALRNAVREMERRLKALAEKGVRNIEQYNRQFERPTTLSLFEDKTDERPLPHVVIIIDELADLMMMDSHNVEEAITRLAQMARAVGIHLILATQRPSVDVITGLIKANFPARISFRVATKVDSRTILDGNGAEALLGRGDMLYLPSGSARLLRVHGALVTEKEICGIVDFWRAQSRPEYENQYLAPPPGADDEEEETEGEEFEGGNDPLYEEAVRLVVEMGKASTSTLQRRMRLGYGRAARLLDIMQRDGIIGPPDGSKPREVLKKPDWLAEVDRQLR